MLKMYHKPNCSKSIEVKKYLKDKGVQPEIIEYLKTPPTLAELKEIHSMLGGEPVRVMMRSKEKIYKELELDNPALSDEELLEAIVAHPILLERPILVKGKRAVIARPTEEADKLL